MKKIYFLSVLCSVYVSSFSQDAIFLNSNQSLIYMNPSFAGSNGGVRNQFSYRNQWPQLSGNMQTFLNTADVYLKPIKAGIAVSVFQDNIERGTLKTNALSLSYAQYLSFRGGDLKIIPSVKFSYAERLLDLNKLQFGDAIDPRYGIVWYSAYGVPPSKKTYFDFSSGLLVNYKNKLYAGASMLHINQPDGGLLGEYKIPYALNIHASYTSVISEKSILQTFCLLNRQDKFNTFRLGVNTIIYNHLVFGVAVVSFDSPIISAGYRNNYFSLLFGYDFSLSRLAGNTIGSGEVHASFNLRNKSQHKTLTSFESM
jgi:type IX secretion system PorP/SprF family membrane protein